MVVSKCCTFSSEHQYKCVWIYVCGYAEINWKVMTAKEGWVICIHSSSYFSYNDITIMISKNNYNSIYGNIFKSFRCSFSPCSAIAFANCHDCTDFVRSETNTFPIFFYRKIIIKRHAHQNEIFKQLVQPINTGEWTWWHTLTALKLAWGRE